MKVSHICMQDFGGAGTAAYWLHKGLQKTGTNSTMLVLNKVRDDLSVKVIPGVYLSQLTPCDGEAKFSSTTWEIQANRWRETMAKYPDRPAGLETFTDVRSDVRLDLIREVQEADLINLHWVPGVFDYIAGHSALAGKPVVWTLHDMNPFTGGCHYAGNCERYQNACGKCPQLSSNIEMDHSRINWNQKRQAYRGLNISIVSPSVWLAECAKDSSLFAGYPTMTIPNGFSIDLFKPHDKMKARKALNISEYKTIILFGANTVISKRKGFIYLIEAMEKLSSNYNQDVLILTFGRISEKENINSRFAIKNLGPIPDEKQLALVYSSADIFVLPTLEDNLPNTIIEAMACGTPTLSFEIGGIPDIVEHKKTGFLARPRNVNDLVDGLNWIISCSSATRKKMTQLCRKKATKSYDIKIQAHSYQKLYEKLVRPK